MPDRLWIVKAEPQRANSDAIAASLEGAKATSRFVEERAAIAALLGLDNDDSGIVRQGHVGGHSLADMFERLLGMEEDTVHRILTFVTAETLEAHAPITDRLGGYLGTDMRNWWTPEQPSSISCATRTP